MKINKLLAVFVLCFSFVGTAMAGLPTSGVETRTGVAHAVTTVDTDVTLSLVHTGPTKMLNKVTYTIADAPVGVVTHLCRMDPTPTCIDVTGVLSITTTVWNGLNTTATYNVVRNVPAGGTVPVDAANVTVKLFYN